MNKAHIFGPKRLDAMKGILAEEQYRGNMLEHPSIEVVHSSAKYWENYNLKDLQHTCRHIECIHPKDENNWPSNPIALGTYQWKYNPEIIEEAISLGVTLIDTAESYGFGRVEKALSLCKIPSSVWVCSKVARNHLSTTATINAARRSADTLGRKLDLYQIHWPNPDRQYGKTLEAMAKLLEEGTIRRVGVCNYSVGQFAQAQKLAQGMGFKIHSNQVRLNAIDNSAKDYLIPTLQAAGVKVIAYSPLGQGKLVDRPRDRLQEVLGYGADYVLFATNKLAHLRENLKR